MFTGLGKIRLATNKPDQFIELELYYHKGGLNVFTYKEEHRGYYLSITPVKVERGFVSFVAFSGRKMLITECQRKSQKAERAAIAEVNDPEIKEFIMENLVKRVAKANGLEVVV